MSEPTNELNRWAHAYLGRGCWHIVDPGQRHKECEALKCSEKDHFACDNCSQLLTPHLEQPDYCSDRNAAAELVEAVVKVVGHGHYADVLERASLDSPYIVTCDEELWGRLALAPARTQVEAAMKAAGGVK